MIELFTPITKEKIATLHKGDAVMISGTIFTARDAAHKRMQEEVKQGKPLLLKGEAIYYAGPCPAKPNEPIGSVGPTTSYRMDTFSEVFLSNGCIVSIGKGKRDQDVAARIRKYGGVHFDAIGGAGAYYKNCVKKATLVAYPDLGSEAVYRLEVENFPCIVDII